MLRKLISFILGISIVTTQTISASDNMEYTYKMYSVKNNVKQLLAESSTNSINYTSLLNSMTNNLFDTNYENITLEIINKTTNDIMNEKKRTEFIPINANTLIDQSDSVFGKTFELEYNDDDGMYVGFIEDHLSTLSRGYFIKKYTKFDKSDGFQKSYIEMGKANFIDDISQNLFNYKLLKESESVQPLLLSYLNYNLTYSKFTAPNTYVENNYGWNGLIDLNYKENTVDDIKAKLKTLKSPVNSIQSRDMSVLTGESNKLFLENGKVLNYRTKTSPEELFAHISLANTYMANNNLKRGFMLKPINSLNNYDFDTHKKCSGKIRKTCKYWQTLEYKGGMDIYTMSFLDESYMDDWKEITYNNSDIITGSVVLPTMIPVNSYANLPSVNNENYGYLYSSNYAGSIGGGIYGYPLSSISGIDTKPKVVKSNTITTKGWTMLAFILVGVFLLVAAPFAIAAIVALPIAVYILTHQHKSSNSGNTLEMTEKEIRNILAISNNIFPQSEGEYGALELSESTILNGIINATNSSEAKKNFMSNTYHDVAWQNAKSNLSQVSSSYFGNTLGILDSMDQNPKFWKNSHKRGIINGYKNSFYNDGKSASSGSKYGAFYNMKTIYRDLVKKYIGY